MGSDNLFASYRATRPHRYRGIGEAFIPFILGRLGDGSPHVDRHKPNHRAGVASLEIRAYRSAEAGEVDTEKPAIFRLYYELGGASAYGKLVVSRAGEAFDAP